MQMKPLPKLVLTMLALVVTFAVVYVWTPKAISAVGELNPAARSGTAVYSEGKVVAPAGYSDGDDAIAQGMYRKVVLNDDITGFPAVDKALRFAWAHCGLLLLVFGFLAFISIASANSEETITHTDGVHPICENMHWAGGGFDGMEETRKRLRIGYVTE